jgi:hypothetical protein
MIAGSARVITAGTAAPDDADRLPRGNDPHRNPVTAVQLTFCAQRHTRAFPLRRCGGRGRAKLDDTARGDEDPMTSTVPCPDCHRPATVIGRFTTGSAEDPTEFLRIRCTGLLTLLVSAADVAAPPTDRAG